jgi:hypothetical protein
MELLETLSIAGPDDELEIVLTTPYSAGAKGVAASSNGLPPLGQIKPSDDGTTDHKEYAVWDYACEHSRPRRRA